MEFKCKLRVIFAEKEIKQGEFAKRVGVSPAAMSSLVNNRSLPSFTVAYAICNELKLSLQEIWVRVEE